MILQYTHKTGRIFFYTLSRGSCPCTTIYTDEVQKRDTVLVSEKVRLPQQQYFYVSFLLFSWYIIKWMSCCNSGASGTTFAVSAVSGLDPDGGRA
jgi:hypothetical protein